MTLAPTIDNYLRSRGSPMAGLGQTFVAAGKKYGVDPRLLVGIATIESGAGAHLAQAYNPFNWGIHRGQQYGSWEESINDVARGLRQNYLNHGLETPEAIVSKYAPSSDGNNESNWAGVVSQVMGKLGGAPATAVGQRTVAALEPPPSAPSSLARTTPAPPPVPMFNETKFGESMLKSIISGRGKIDYSALPGLTEQAWETPAPPPATPKPATGFSPALVSSGPTTPLQPVKGGKGITPPLVFKSTHETSGLGWPAIDIMGAPGTPVRSPISGTVKYFHPTGAQGGGSMEIVGDDGTEYWIGHIADGLPEGSRITRGTELAVISADHPRPHVHWAKR